MFLSVRVLSLLCPHETDCHVFLLSISHNIAIYYYYIKRRNQISLTSFSSLSIISLSAMSSSLWFYSYVKIRFFNRVQRFLRSKTSRKRFRRPSDPSDMPRNKVVEKEEEEEKSIGNYDQALVLQKTMKSLHFGNWEEKEMATKNIQKLLKGNMKIRKLIVDLGVIHALVSMVDSYQLVAVKALIELANDNFTNKALMMEEGILSKLPNNTQSIPMDSSSHEFAELLLSLSSLANTQPFLAYTQTVISFLLSILNSESNTKTETETETRNSCLSTLFNISTVLENAETLISNGAIPTLLRFSSTKEFSEKALPILGNLAVTLKGKQALEKNIKFPGILIEILTWEEKPKCQELSAYIIMIIAHQSSAQRERLAKSGIVPALLELALLGSPLAQKRALKLLQWFKDERQARVGAHSGPQTRRVVCGEDLNKREIEMGKNVMRNLVRESLCKNMEMITQRANYGECPKFRTLVSSTSSKSLPY